MGIALWGAMVLAGWWRPERSKSFVLTALCVGASNLLFLAGVEYSSVSSTVLIFCSFPALSLALECLVSRRLPHARDIVIVALALLGVYVVVGSSSEVTLLGSVFAFGSTAAWVIALHIGAKSMRFLQFLTATASGSIWTALVALPLLLLDYPDMPTSQQAWGTLAVGVITLIAYIPCSLSIGKIEPHLSGVVQLTELPAALALAYLINSEPITSSKILGAAMILVAAISATLPRKEGDKP